MIDDTPLTDFTDKELIEFLDSNETIALKYLGAICSEILRRMNKRKDLLPEKKWEHTGPLC